MPSTPHFSNPILVSEYELILCLSGGDGRGHQHGEFSVIALEFIDGEQGMNCTVIPFLIKSILPFLYRPGTRLPKRHQSFKVKFYIGSGFGFIITDQHFKIS